MKTLTVVSLFAAVVLGQLGSTALSATDLFSIQTLSCDGTQTYTGYIPTETVTITVDGNYTYTGAANDSLPTAAIYYTPLPPCSSVLVPEPEPSTTEEPSTPSFNTTTSSSTTTTTSSTISPSTSVTTLTQTLTSTYCSTTFADANSTAKTGAPYANTTTGGVPITSCSSETYTTTSIQTFSVFTSEASFGTVPLVSSVASSFSESSPSPQPVLPTTTTNPGNQGPPEVSAENSAARTSVATVTVTKKTPVQAPAENTGPQIAFPGETDGVGSPDQVSPTGGGANTNGGNTGAGNVTPTGGNNPTGGGNNNNPTPTGGDKPTGNNNNNNNNNNGGTNNPTGGNQNPTGGNGNPTGGNNNTPGPSSTGGGIGSIINSAFNSPWTSVGVTTAYGAASATVTLVNGVPVQVDSSSVYIGGSYVALPTGSSTAVVVVNGLTFSVAPDAVIGGSSTLEIQRPESVSYSPVQAATLKASTITQNGVVVTIEPDAAIVDGTTYSIGLNADETTVVVDGQTITLNSNGVAFASTTYAPAITTAAAYVVTTIGDLTFSIDPSEAIISGTTYRIGAGALNSETTAVIDGTTVVFGPSGVELPSTTIAPTGVSLTASDAESTRTSATARVVSDSTAAATSSDNAAMSAVRPPVFLSNTLCALAMTLSLVTLPLGLLL